MTLRRTVKMVFALVLILLAGGLTACNNTALNEESLYTVAPHDMVLYLQETGRVGSIEEFSVRAAFDAPLVKLLPEGEKVKQGGVLGRLESSAQTQERDAQRLALQEARVEQELTLWEMDTEAQGLQHNLRQAQLAVEEQSLRLEQLTTERDTAELIRIRAGLASLEERMKMLELETRERERLFKLGYLSQQERDQSVLDLKLARQEKAQLLTEQKIATAGPPAVDISRQKQQLARARQKLSLLQKEQGLKQQVTVAQKKAARIKIERARKSLQYYQQMIDASTLTSRATGTVVYGKLNLGEEQVPIKAGDSLKEGVEIVKIVNLKRPLIRLTLHEIDAPRIAVGQPADIRLDAYPEKRFTGRVSRMLPIARPQENNDRLNLRGVQCEIEIDTAQAREDQVLDVLRPGMTCSVNMQTRKRAQVLSVPTEALLREQNKTFCVVQTAQQTERREVVTGISDMTHTEIISGLKAGEQVHLRPDEVEL